MQIRHTIAYPNHGERIANHAATIERAKHLPARVRRYNKRRDRLDFQIRLTPNQALEFHATLKVLELLALADPDPSAHFRACAFASSRVADSPSASFVPSQRASISSRRRSLNSRPDSRARASIARNRCENFALAFFRAISGSTCRNRAKFTAANKKSPISSSVLRWSFSCTALSSSTVSSRILSMTPFALSQSNPIREALRVS